MTSRTRRWLVSAALAAGLVPAWPAHASHNTCALINQAGGEAAVESRALVELNKELPKHFSDKVTVGRVPVTNDPIRVEVDATVKKPAKNVNLTCASSGVAIRVDIRVRVSGRAGSDTHEGEGRITGHYTIQAGTPPRVCVSGLKMAGLNLHGVQNDVDDYIRKQINKSGLVKSFCLPS